MLETLKSRRSVRSYKPDPIEDEKLDAILEAGLYAASGMNTQRTVLVAVQDKQTRDQLSRMNGSILGVESDPFYGAPCVVVVLAEPESKTPVEDGALVMANLMQAAHEIGVGSCWIHRAKEMFAGEEGKQLLRQWGLRDDLLGVGNCILGYARSVPGCSPRREGRIVKV